MAYYLHPRAMSSSRITKPSLEWRFKEFVPPHDRGTLWYVTTGAVVGGLLVYSFSSANYLFAVLILVTVFVLFSHQVFTPPVMHCVISGEGIDLNDRRYAFREFDYFWIVVNAEVGKMMYLHHRKGLGTVLSIPIPPNVAVSTVKEVIGQYVEESDEYDSEPAWDKIMRVLKI